MTAHAIVLDAEFLVSEGAQQRWWCGPHDPDPVVAQIGAVRLSLAGEYEIVGDLRLLVRPVDRHGRDFPVDPLFTRLTGLDAETIAREGRPLGEALDALARFADGARLFSWGKDELNLAMSAFVEGIAMPIPAARFDNACRLALAAGMPYAEVQRTRSPDLPARVGLPRPPLRAHDALDDAMSVAIALRHLLRTGRLSAEDFAAPSPSP